MKHSAPLTKTSSVNFWRWRLRKAPEVAPPPPPTAFEVLLEILVGRAAFTGLVFLFIGSSGVIFGVAYSLDPGLNDKLPLVWQMLLQLLAAYCTVLPVMRDQVINRQENSPVKIKVEYTIFYATIAVSVIMAILTPVATVMGNDEVLKVKLSTTFNFISNVFAVIGASQLVAGLTNDLTVDRL